MRGAVTRAQCGQEKEKEKEKEQKKERDTEKAMGAFVSLILKTRTVASEEDCQQQ